METQKLNTCTCCLIRVANIRLILNWNIVEFGKNRGASFFCLYIWNRNCQYRLVNPASKALSGTIFPAAMRNAGSKSDKQ